MDLFRLREHLSSSLWFVPALFVAIALALAGVLLSIDRAVDSDYGVSIAFTGTPDSARNMLSTIASSIITFTGLVFSITIVVLQLASSQFSPRVLRSFLRDRHSQFALGMFIATFAYTLLVLREVRDEVDGREQFVPGLSIGVAFLLVLGSLAVFVDYIHHIAQAIRASTIVDRIGDETREVIDELYPAERRGKGLHPGPSGPPERADRSLGPSGPPERADRSLGPSGPPERADRSTVPEAPGADRGAEARAGRQVPEAPGADRGAEARAGNPGPGDAVLPPETAVIRCSHRYGVVQGVDTGDLIGMARHAGCVLSLVPRVGDFVPTDAPLFVVHGDGRKLDAHDVIERVSLGRERTMRQDAAFGFRQLVDIASKALSPAINDPTTAVQALDQLHDLLRRLAVRPWPSPVLGDSDGAPRLVVSLMQWDDYLRLAVEEIRLYGAGSLQIDRRLRSMLEDLRTVAPPEHLSALAREVGRLDQEITEDLKDAEDQRSARSDMPYGHEAGNQRVGA